MNKNGIRNRTSTAFAKLTGGHKTKGDLISSPVHVRHVDSVTKDQEDGQLNLADRFLETLVTDDLREAYNALDKAGYWQRFNPSNGKCDKVALHIYLVFANYTKRTGIREIPEDVRKTQLVSLWNQRDIPLKQSATMSAQSQASLDHDDLDTKKREVNRYCDAVPSSSRYKNMKNIGSGAFAIVQLAMDTMDNDALVAMKMMELPKMNKKHLIGELVALRDLHHPNIINFKSSYIEDSQIVVVMEYMDGNALTSLVNKPHQYRLSEPEIAYVAYCLFSGLKYLHTKKYAHRDIKSDNILVGTNGCCKLTDFGMCAKLGMTKNHTTQAGTTLWMAPEMMRTASYNGQEADVWAAGIVLVECLDGYPPYWRDAENDGQMAVLSTIKDLDDHPPIENLLAASLSLQELVLACLKVSSNTRPTSAQAKAFPFLELRCTEQDFAETVTRLKSGGLS